CRYRGRLIHAGCSRAYRSFAADPGLRLVATRRRAVELAQHAFAVRRRSYHRADDSTVDGAEKDFDGYRPATARRIACGSICSIGTVSAVLRGCERNECATVFYRYAFSRRRDGELFHPAAFSAPIAISTHGGSLSIHGFACVQSHRSAAV